MTLQLAIDTATDVGSVALGEPGRILAETRFSERRHASVLAPAVDHVLRLAGVKYEDLTGIVVADGPGSFTGLRIGFAHVHGLLSGRDDLVLSTVPSLLAAAWPSVCLLQRPVAAVYDAYRGEVFGAVYGLEARTILAPLCCSVEELTRRSPVIPAVAVGDGAALYGEQMRDWTNRDPASPSLGSPRAATLLELLAVPGAVTPVADVAKFEPTYGRQAAAQDRWESTHGRPLHDPSRDRD